MFCNVIARNIRISKGSEVSKVVKCQSQKYPNIKGREVSKVVQCQSRKYQNIKRQGSIKCCAISEPEISEYQRAGKYQKFCNVRGHVECELQDIRVVVKGLEIIQIYRNAESFPRLENEEIES